MNRGELLCLCVVKMQRKKIKILTVSLCCQVGYYLIIAFPQRFSYRNEIYLCLVVFLLLFFLKYKILKMFCFVFFSTKRVDHSNTRLASQLDRNPGNSPVCNEAIRGFAFCVFLYTYPCVHTHSHTQPLSIHSFTPCLL